MPTPLEEQRRYFVPPPARAIEGTFLAAERDRVLYGFTVVELRCSSCGDVKSTELPGNALEAPERRAEARALGYLANEAGAEA